MTDPMTGVMRRLKVVEDYLWKKKTYPVKTNLANAYYPEEYNAVGGGLVDDTAAIQATIGAAGYKGPVVLTQPSYRITGSGLTLGGNQVLMGSGRYQTNLIVAGSRGIQATGNSWEIQNIGITPDTGNWYGFTGLKIGTGSNGCTVRGLRVSGANVGVELNGMIYFLDMSDLQLAPCLTNGILFSYNTGYPNGNTFHLKFITGMYEECIRYSQDRSFSSAGHWTGAHWTLGGGVLTHAAGGAPGVNEDPALLTNLYVSGPYGSGHKVVSGVGYTVTFTVASRTAGSVTPYVGTGAGGAGTTNGTYVSTCVASADDVDLTFVPSWDFDGSIDNIAVTLAADATRVGIACAGNTNTFEGGEINNFSIGIENTGSVGGGMNRFINYYSENNRGIIGAGDYAFHNVSGAAVWHGLSGASRIRNEPGAVTLSLTGGFGDLQLVSPLNLPLRDCTGLYLFKEGSGTSIADSLHAAHAATIAGAAPWIPGMSFWGVDCDSASGQYISLPIDLVDPAAFYTFIVVWKPIALNGASYVYNDILMLNKSADYHRIYTPGNGSMTYQHRNHSGANNSARGVNAPYQEADDWSILAFGYDPVNGLVYMRHPYAYTWTATYALTNYLTATLTSIRLNGDNSYPHRIAYSLAASWKRDLTYEESLAFCNNIPMLGMLG